MNEVLEKQVLEMAGASTFNKLEVIQSLWSGYGEISRYQLRDSLHKQAILKHVKLPGQSQHPKGWNTERSHQRKIRSYQVECTWYQNYSAKCDEECRVPKTFGATSSESEFLMVMEDLASAGFSELKDRASLHDMALCLRWLANFHATFMNTTPCGLWPIGTYWHLDTRPDELTKLSDLELKNAASLIDEQLNNSPYQTFVHGDAKLANFCFAHNGNNVAAVDFQYVGGGCGMKDVAYFIGSCLDAVDCERYEAQLLDLYFKSLHKALKKKQPQINPEDVEATWRPLFSLAWTDFHRFLKGWSPDHWKIHSYSESLSKTVIEQVNKRIQGAQ